ncbi:protein of unknown function DUF6 transmembrane [Sulfobacillus acidophilus DSM 10332]|uniref:EamA domain-containing protein n=1 Tax=Sulfobacillus acidophilus (strain ATCC 700253 / DSM 10332 / NAL) TaxID=679936 RepID=G8TYK5_SULAD|nr:protein of unknown function DUF6 transmembrane [Sulfobacillus acidophilus DSM 10332]
MKYCQLRIPRRLQGYLMVLLSATFWGVSGTAAQKLFVVGHVHPGWLVSIRMLGSGALLLLGSVMRQASTSLRLLKRAAWGPLLAFAIVGLLGVQYTYFEAIHTGNAAMATLLQYMGPSFIAVYGALTTRRWPSPVGFGALLLALGGTLLLVTGGHLAHLAVPATAIVWGLLSALFLAFYTIYPVPLIRQWGSLPVVGWGMVIGGLVAAGLTRFPDGGPSRWTPSILGLVLFVVLIGTLLAFFLYLASLTRLSPTEASIAGSAEPISAVLAATLWLHVRFTSMQMVGGMAIVAAVVVVAWLRPFEQRSSASAGASGRGG